MSKPDILPLHTIMPLIKQVEKLPLLPALTFQQALSLVRYHVTPHTENGRMFLHPIFDNLHLVRGLPIEAIKEFYFSILRHESKMKVKLFLSKKWHHHIFEKEVQDNQAIYSNPSISSLRRFQIPKRPMSPQQSHMVERVRPPKTLPNSQAHHKPLPDSFSTTPQHRIQEGFSSSQIQRPHSSLPQRPHTARSRKTTLSESFHSLSDKRTLSPQSDSTSSSEVTSYVILTPQKEMARVSGSDCPPTQESYSCPSIDGFPSCEGIASEASQVRQGMERNQNVKAENAERPTHETPHKINSSFSSCVELQAITQAVKSSSPVQTEKTKEALPLTQLISTPEQEFSEQAPKRTRPHWTKW